MTDLRNAITDIAGLKVGHCQDEALRSGVTALICDRPAVAACQVLGGAPGTRETDLLEPHNLVQRVDGVVLSGGSAFGLEAAGGVAAALREAGRGFPVGQDIRVPIVPAAVLFDLANGGDKDWGRFSPYADMGYRAASSAGADFAIGSCGAGTGATTATLKGGIGTASMRLDDGTLVAALIAVNAVGSATIGTGRHFWAAPFENDAEFGALGVPSPLPDDATALRPKSPVEPGANTTIGIVATDRALSKAGCKRLAIAAHDGLARAIWPAHTPMDGDCIFALSTSHHDVEPDAGTLLALGAAAAMVTARAIARGVYAATGTATDTVPAWSSL